VVVGYCKGMEVKSSVANEKGEWPVTRRRGLSWEKAFPLLRKVAPTGGWTGQMDSAREDGQLRNTDEERDS
jgi:hypothetical protein